MLRRYLILLKNFDWVLFGAVFLLITFGLAALYSIAISSETPDFANFRKQIIFALIGLILLLLISLLNYRIWQHYSLLIYLAISFLLLLVIFFGKTIRGTTGWFSLLGVNFQVVELAKISLILMLAWFLHHYANRLAQLRIFLISAAICLVYFLLVIFQPDLGSAIILFLIWFWLILFGGAKKKHLLVLGLILIIIATLAWFFLFADYQRGRILTFINPASDPYGRGYHVRQAIIAVGAGGFLGRGLGFGSQSQLKFIPASQTDFIFAVIAEELGFLGVSLVIGFWALILYRLAKAIMLMKDDFALFFTLGVSALFFSQLMINIGMNIGLLPVTGISLPFLSYGGSFLIVSLVLIGIVESMIIRNRS
ncbi:MAG: hypothetical protein A2912_04380 [Candidatus Buchananbacteria bacterium RIFCSPLOWO2_01_FULL_40_23b]|uniref:Rod shape-determining protein RodA n=1 Tax=Candidatus Buchananbacteria bacterium RIFCSPLOWO2_01_FULL_40_23b TaxID=1797544 RepID=A0A1G1YRJ5_9BACT|nr:MAG: hypothetical protein A2912_04380 [Candidatus Buchananbacteria bacterium RIFCSPLOWO2_01_FULL_40_23b]